MTFGKEIKNLREKKGLKQYELAEKLGFKPAYLCDIENARRKPQSNKFIENVCEVLELTDKERKHLYELSYNLPENITNKKQELLSQVANMELRDQIEAKEQMIKNLKGLLEQSLCWLLTFKNCDNSQKKPLYINDFNDFIDQIDEVLNE